MLYKIFSGTISKAFKTIDWKLLLFLVLFLNVKLVIKLAAIILIYVLQWNFNFGFRLHKSRLPVFYVIVTGIAIFNRIIIGGFSPLNYTIAVLTAVFFWSLSILAMHQVKLSVEQNPPSVIHKTITVFFIMNAVVSFSVLIAIVFKTGAINPYLYQGEYQKYFIGTGDYIRGISFDTSTTNAVLNGFGVIYFLIRKKPLMVMLTMSVMLLTGSNITNLLLGCVLLLIFIFQSNKDQKSLIALCFLMLVLFLSKVSPQNNNYVTGFFKHYFKIKNEKKSETSLIPLRERPGSLLSPEEKKEKIATLYLDSLYRLHNKNVFQKTSFIQKLELPSEDINSAPYQHESMLTPVEKKMLRFIQVHSLQLPLSSDSVYTSPLPGKIIAMNQTFNFLKRDPLKIISGAGAGNFSSKLAFRTTGLNIAGGYPKNFIYLSPAFLSNHLDLYLKYFTKDDEVHSIANNPNSVYDQLLSEYGLLGFTAFFIFYAGFFIKRYKNLSYGIPLLVFLSAIFMVDYWFEQLSIAVFFELLLFLNLKEEVQK